VARLGGDEFVVMAHGLTSEPQARELGEKILEAFRAPFKLEEGEIVAEIKSSEATGVGSG